MAALREQSLPFELLVFDNASTDGTLEEVEKFASQIIHVPKGKYVPGQVLNRGMELSHGEIVVFLNSDCTPQNRHWLERLVQAMESENKAHFIFDDFKQSNVRGAKIGNICQEWPGPASTAGV